MFECPFTALLVAVIAELVLVRFLGKRNSFSIPYCFLSKGQETEFSCNQKRNASKNQLISKTIYLTVTPEVKPEVNRKSQCLDWLNFHAFSKASGHHNQNLIFLKNQWHATTSRNFSLGCKFFRVESLWVQIHISVRRSKSD